MPSTRRLAILASLALVGGCASDNSLSPTKPPPSPSVVAHHLDSLYESTVASYPTRAAVLSYAELAPAFGAVPSAITTTTIAHGDSAAGDSTLHTWSGFEIEVISATDTWWYFVAYSDSNVTNAIVIERDNNTPGGAVLLANGTTSVSTDLTFGAMGQTTIGSSCVPVTGLSNPTVASFGQATCQLASFNSLMVGEFTVPPNVNPGFAKIVIESTTWNGVIFHQ